MADLHEEIKWKVISEWSVKDRGRLYCMNQGMATPLNGNHPIWFGPLKRKFKGFPDLFGFAFDEEIGMRSPIFTVIEVKTKSYSTLSKHQKIFMKYIISIGGRAYVAMEDDSEKGYSLKEWKE